MKYSDVIGHLGKHGFITRGAFFGQSVIFFGVDNMLWRTSVGDIRQKNRFNLTLSDVRTEDWEIIYCYWDSPYDDFKPFDMGLISPIYQPSESRYGVFKGLETAFDNDKQGVDFSEAP